MSESFDHKAFLATVPHQPGVYRMLDEAGGILYVGKAKDLTKRLSSYFRRDPGSEKTRALVRHIRAIEFTVTHTETEALILEHNLIKQHQPKYNILLRDDKSYPFILLSHHRHPRVSIHRGPRKVAGDYFGPYPSGGAVRESLHLMQKLFPIRQCEDSVYANRSRPCLLYQLKRCAGPCVHGLVSDEEYQMQVDLARLFLQGKDQQVIADLVAKMEQASNELAFEAAARYRDQVLALRKVQEQQSVSGNVLDDLDVIGANGAGKSTLLMSIFGQPRIRSGQILFGGEDISHKSTHYVASGGIAQAPEGRRIFPDMTVEENLLMGTIPIGSQFAAEDMQTMFDLFPRLKERRKQRAMTMSGGEQQMLAIARALMSRPKLLLLDEPSLGLAPIVVKQIFQTLRELARNGMTIFLVEQNAHHALKLSDRGYVMVNGQIRLSGSGEELLGNQEVRKAYLGGV